MIRLAAPAKLNLHLRVLSLRADGFHAIESLFARLDLQDDVEIELGGGGIHFETTGDYEVPGDGRNLCVTAATSFFEATRVEPGVRIHLLKRIPVAAGLGGGSSDAASVLLGLNQLHGEPLDHEALSRVGASIGSDVPFFLLRKPFALGEGRGDELTPLSPPAARPVLIMVPDFGVSARDAYAWYRQSRPSNATESTEQPLAAMADGTDWPTLARISTNDLAPGVFTRHPVLAASAAALASTGAFITLLCGSGSCLAGLYDSLASRDASAAELRSNASIPEGWRLIATRVPG